MENNTLPVLLPPLPPKPARSGLPPPIPPKPTVIQQPCRKTNSLQSLEIASHNNEVCSPTPKKEQIYDALRVPPKPAVIQKQPCNSSQTASQNNEVCSPTPKKEQIYDAVRVPQKPAVIQEQPCNSSQTLEIALQNNEVYSPKIPTSKKEQIYDALRVTPKPAVIQKQPCDSSQTASQNNEVCNPTSKKEQIYDALRVPPKPAVIQKQLCDSSQTLEITSQTSEVCKCDNPTQQIYDAIKVSPQLPLCEIMTKFTTQIPLRLSVCGSVYGIGGESSLYDGELLDVHFIKKTAVVHAVSSSGRKLIVPVNTSMQCSILYDPIWNTNFAETGFVFPTTSRLFKTGSLPQVVAVKQSFVGRKKLSSFAEGEVLVLKGFDGRKKLRCISIPSTEKKVIHESMKISFTTEPLKLKLYLSDIVQHLNLPVKAKFYSTNIKLQQQVTVPHILTKLSSEQSLIASDHINQSNGDSPHSGSIVEILTNVPITFDVVELHEDERQQLCEKSKSLFENFHPSCIKKVIANISATETRAQTMVFQCVQGGEAWKNGVILTFKAIVSPRDKACSENSIEHISEPSESPTTDRCGSVSCISLHTNYSYHKFVHPLSEYSSADSLHYYYPHCDDVDLLKKELLHLQCSNIELMKHAKELQRKLDEGCVNTKTQTTEDLPSRQIRLLNLSVDEVLLILEKLGLDKYENKFREENITGSLLSDLDEDVLKKELGIESRIHRIKLMRVIDGRQSIDELLNSE